MTITKKKAPEVSVCVFVYNRYDLLRKMLLSLVESNIKPTWVYIIDHGYNNEAVMEAIDGIAEDLFHIRVVMLDDPGAAHGFNWFIANVPGERIFVSDDIQFLPDTIERMLATEGDFVGVTEANGHPFNTMACCLIRQSCYDKVGLFDERMSPQYLYFEDCDFSRRMQLAGASSAIAEGAKVIHENGGSQTLRKIVDDGDEAQMSEHHRKFRIAMANYVYKWGGGPGEETLTTPRPLPEIAGSTP